MTKLIFVPKLGSRIKSKQPFPAQGALPGPRFKCTIPLVDHTQGSRRTRTV